VSDYLKQSDVDPVLAGEAPTRPTLVPVVEPFALTGPPPLAGWLRSGLADDNEALAPALGTALSSLLGTPFEVAAAPAERVAGAELKDAVGAPCAAFALTAGAGGPLVGFLAFELDLAYFLIERLLGGGGADSFAPPPPAHGEAHGARTLTRLEQLLLEDVAQRLIGPFARLAGRPAGVTPALGSFESDLARLAPVAANEPFLSLAYEVADAGPRAWLTFALALKAVATSAGAAAAGTDGKGAPANVRGAAHGAPAATAKRSEHPDLARALVAARVTLRARLPQFRLKARTVLALAEGQILDTGHDADAPLELLVNERPRFRGSIGRVRRRLGVRVNETWNPDAASLAPDRLREGRVL